MSLEAIANSIKLLAGLAGVIVIAYAGLMLTTSRDALIRSQWKEIILGVLIGLSLVFLAPVLASGLSGGNYCEVG